MAVKRMMSLIIGAVCLVVLSSPLLWAQEDQTAGNQTQEAQAPAQEPAVTAVSNGAVVAPAEAPKAPEAKSTEWVWGEVVSASLDKKQVVIKHLDYETYEEAQTTLDMSDKTLFENVTGLGEIKTGDHLTADYKVVNGANVADLIVVEKDTAAAPGGSEAPEEEKVAPTGASAENKVQ